MSRFTQDTMDKVLDGRAIRPRVFLYLDFPSTKLRAWNGDRNITIVPPGRTGTWQWIPSAGVINIDGIVHSLDTGSQALQITFEATIQSNIGLAHENLWGREAAVWLGWGNFVGGVINNEIANIYTGIMDSSSIQRHSDGAIINIKAEQIILLMNRIAARLRTTRDHSAANPGDKFYDKVARLVDTPLRALGPRYKPPLS